MRHHLGDCTQQRQRALITLCYEVYFLWWKSNCHVVNPHIYTDLTAICDLHAACYSWLWSQDHIRWCTYCPTNSNVGYTLWGSHSEIRYIVNHKSPFYTSSATLKCELCVWMLMSELVGLAWAHVWKWQWMENTQPGSKQMWWWCSMECSCLIFFSAYLFADLSFADIAVH